MATALFLCDYHLYTLSSPYCRKIAHVCSSGLQIRNPTSETRICSCFDNHGLVAKPPTRKATCPWSAGGRVQGASEWTYRIGRKAFLEVIPDGVRGGSNRGFEEIGDLCPVYKFCGRSRIGVVGTVLPFQRQPSSPNPTLGIIVPWGSKSHVLVRCAVRNRKDLLHPFIKPLRERCQVFRGVVLGTLQFLWLSRERLAGLSRYAASTCL